MQLHKESPLGDAILECYASGTRNVFVLGFVPVKSGGCALRMCPLYVYAFVCVCVCVCVCTRKAVCVLESEVFECMRACVCVCCRASLRLC